MKRYISALISIILIITVLSVSAVQYYTHPKELLSGVREGIANGAEPWAGAYAKLKNTIPVSVASGVPATFQIPRFDAVLANTHRDILTNNAHNAYWHALVYIIEGNTASADIVVGILDSWAQNNAAMKYNDSDPTKKYDTQLVAATTGVGLVYAAELIDGYSGFTYADRAAFKAWVQNVLLPTVNGIRNRTNNWASWGAYTSAVCNDYLGNSSGFAENTSYLKNNIDSQIDYLGRMPEELKRDIDDNGNSVETDQMNGVKGLWYTYYTLAPMVAHAELVYSKTGENIFEYESAGDEGSIKKALDRLLVYVKNYGAYNPKLADPNYKYRDPNLIPYPTSIWPANLYESMAAVYGDMSYYDFIGGDNKRPVEYDRVRLGFSLMFPTLLKNPMTIKPYTTRILSAAQDGKSYAEVQIVNNFAATNKKVLFVTASYNNTQLQSIKAQQITLSDGLKHTYRLEMDGGNAKAFLIDLDTMEPILKEPLVK